MFIRGKEYNCTIDLTLDILGGKWKISLLWAMIKHGPQRFGELKRHCNGISSKVLTQQLKELEQDELITRKAYDEKPPRVEYALSAFGKSIIPIIKEMHLWSVNYLNRNGYNMSPCIHKNEVTISNIESA